MKKNKHNKIDASEILIIGILLSFIGGFLDAYTYMLRGGVLANAQTGNIVLLALNISELNIQKIILYIIPITSFILGMLLTEFFKRKLSYPKYIYWHQMVILSEMIIIFIIGMLGENISNLYATTLISFVCAIQISAFRKVNGLIYATTMCTGNLRSLCDNLLIFIIDKNKQHLKYSLIYTIIILLFILGAIIGFLTSNLLGHKSLFICCIILLTIFFISFKKN